MKLDWPNRCVADGRASRLQFGQPPLFAPQAEPSTIHSKYLSTSSTTSPQSRSKQRRHQVAQRPPFLLSLRSHDPPPASTPPIHTTDTSSPQFSKTGRNTSIYMKREKSRKQILCFSRPEACHRLKQLGIQGGRHGGTRSHTIAPSAADRCDRNFKALGSFEISPT